MYSNQHEFTEFLIYFIKNSIQVIFYFQMINYCSFNDSWDNISFIVNADYYWTLILSIEVQRGNSQLSQFAYIGLGMLCFLYFLLELYFKFDFLRGGGSIFAFSWLNCLPPSFYTQMLKPFSLSQSGYSKLFP